MTGTFVDVVRSYSTADCKSVECGSMLPRKQRREEKVAKKERDVAEQKKKKVRVEHLKSFNAAKTKRMSGSEALLSCRECCPTRKLKFSEAAAAVVKHAKAPSMKCAPCAPSDLSRGGGGNVVLQLEGLEQHYVLGDDGAVKTWSGPLLSYDMRGWLPVKGGFVRPRPACYARGMAIREPTTQFQWLSGMKEMVEGLIVNHTAATAPCENIANKLAMCGSWDDLLCPTKSQVRNFVSAHFARMKKVAEHAVARQGKRSYVGFSLQWLKKEVEHRNLTVGRRQRKGCIELLEKHDDENENELATYHRANDYQDEPVRLGFTAFRRSIESDLKGVPLLEWLTKECAYQEIETTARLREAGLARLLFNQYLQSEEQILRHDGTHDVGVDNEYRKGDKVEVFWRKKWYGATVTRAYPNNTWDVLYPPPSDQIFCKRLPAALLRPSTDDDDSVYE